MPGNTRMTLSASSGYKNDAASLIVWYAEVATSILRTDNGSAKTAVPVRSMESEVRFSDNMTWTSLYTVLLLILVSGADMVSYYPS